MAFPRPFRFLPSIATADLPARPVRLTDAEFAQIPLSEVVRPHYPALGSPVDRELRRAADAWYQEETNREYLHHCIRLQFIPAPPVSTGRSRPILTSGMTLSIRGSPSPSRGPLPANVFNTAAMLNRHIGVWQHAATSPEGLNGLLPAAQEAVRSMNAAVRSEVNPVPAAAPWFPGQGYMPERISRRLDMVADLPDVILTLGPTGSLPIVDSPERLRFVSFS